MHSTLLSLADAAKSASTFCDSFYHGEDHWRSVTDQALWLAEQHNRPRQERLFLFLFGATHDCRRENDDRDPEHGARAAQWVQENTWAHTLAIPHLETRLLHALVFHDKGKVSPQDALVGTAWDADRSLLGRVGITPNPHYFSVAQDHVFDAMIARADALYEHGPMDWHALAARALA